MKFFVGVKLVAQFSHAFSSQITVSKRHGPRRSTRAYNVSSSFRRVQPHDGDFDFSFFPFSSFNSLGVSLQFADLPLRLVFVTNSLPPFFCLSCCTFCLVFALPSYLSLSIWLFSYVSKNQFIQSDHTYTHTHVHLCSLTRTSLLYTEQNNTLDLCRVHPITME